MKAILAEPEIVKCKGKPASVIVQAKIPSLPVGVAGEYFVAAELSRRGYIASISLRNTRCIDILATNEDSSKSITIQCKTNQRGKKDWLLNYKSERYYSNNHFYGFVVLGEPNECLFAPVFALIFLS